MLKIILVDDHEVVRLGLRMLLEQSTDFQVIAEAGTATEAIRLCEMHQPDVVVMDIRMPPGNSGIEACRTIVERCPQTRVIMLTSYAEDELIADAIQAGAVGYVLKQGGTGELMRALEAVQKGDALLNTEITGRVLYMLRRREQANPDPFKDLTKREFDILRLLADGKSNGEIARILILSDKTVRNHISIILDKLNVTNRVEAATYAVSHHIHTISPHAEGAAQGKSTR